MQPSGLVPQDPYERSLEWFLDFKSDDLAANRAGSLSSAQSARLLWSGVWRLGFGPILLLSGLVVGFEFNLALVAVIALAVAAFG